MGCKDEQQSYDHLIFYISIACAFIYILACTGGTCGTYESGCSTNDGCLCFQTADGNGLCDIPRSCDTVADCSVCLAANMACVTNSCCEGPICGPLINTDGCPPPSNRQAANLFRSNVLKRVKCDEDKDCEFGESCILHTSGRFCVWLIVLAF